MKSRRGGDISKISCKLGEPCQVLRNLNYHNLSNNLVKIRKEERDRTKEKSQTMFIFTLGWFWLL